MNRITVGAVYRHFKGSCYLVVAIAEHTETGEPMVVYKSLHGRGVVYTRSLYEFESEVDHWKYPEVTQKYRFEKVEV